MTITPHLFAAYLKCPTKCWLRSTGESASGNVYAGWVRDRDEASREKGIKRLIAEAPEGFQSEAAKKCKDRFEKNRGKLFTFLEHDGVPWNNNNAEHAIKAFAALRDVMLGSSTQNGLDDYLILLSVCQTCKYRGVDFLDFLRSGEKNVHAFAEKYRRRKPAHQSTAPAMFLTGPATQAMGADESAI